MTTRSSNGMSLGAIIRGVRRVVYLIPGTQHLWVRFNRAIGREGRPHFSGWGMVTEALPPWVQQPDGITRAFAAVNAELISKVVDGTFKLSQFHGVQDPGRRLAELMWRHYVVFWSARYASLATTVAGRKTIVECGVCDGLTAYFAMSALNGHKGVEAVLYDAWEGMKSDYLLESEKGAQGAYSYLEMESTRENLRQFDPNVVFVKGFLPESFRSAKLPTDIIWLHVDLNSSIPTKAALEQLYGNMPAGAVILFDDYGWGGYHDTKIAVDEFFHDKRGLLLPLPTGQAVFFKV